MAGERLPICLRKLAVQNLRGYARLELELGLGPQLIFGPNAAGKTTLLEAVVLLALGRSHRTSTDGELIRWGADFMRIEGELSRVETRGADRTDALLRAPAPASLPEPAFAPEASLSVALAAGGRKKILVNGVPRRPSALTEHLRIVLFGPEEMMLIVGSPGLRRSALDAGAAPHDRAYDADLTTYERALAQRNSLLRSIREGQAQPDQLRLWDEPFLTAGSAIVESRLRFLDSLAGPLAAVHAEIAPAEERLRVAYSSNAAPLPGETVRDALARRLRETSDKELWNGATLVGPHRDDLLFLLGDRELRTFSSRGQQRTAILAFKMAQLDLLTALDGRPPLLLLDDVFSELDPERRAHLVRRIGDLPQALVTTTDPEEIDPELRGRARAWRVVAADGGSRVEEAEP